MKYVGSWFLLISAVQFHIPFYSSRMLPNTFALVIVLFMYSDWIDGKIQRAAAKLVFATAVFRCDLLLLLFTLGLTWIGMGQLSILNALKVGILTGIVSLITTAPLDSILWQRLLWPEGEVFYFNTILGKSKEWGTMPWHWYFSSAIPKSMLFTLLLTPFAFIRISNVLSACQQWMARRDKRKDDSNFALVALLDFQWLQYILPSVAFICIYSCLGHKEMRFIFPALPLLNLAAAAGMCRLSEASFSTTKGRKKPLSMFHRAMFAGGIFCLLGTYMASLVFVAVSRLNYPGGEGLRVLARHIEQQQQQQNNDDEVSSSLKSVHVHVDVAAAMSGVSLFGQKAAELQSPNIRWTFSKGGYEEEHAMDGNDSYDKFTHLITENANTAAAAAVPESFRVISTIQGQPRLNIRNAKISTQDTIYVLEKTNVVV